MTPAARVAAAIEVLDHWLGSDARAEKLLRDWGRRSRYAGSKDRRAVADLVYEALRHRRSYGWGRGAETGRTLMAGLVAATGDLDAMFSGQGYGPAALSDEERGDGAAMPDPVALDYPDWLDGPLRRAFGDDLETGLTALRARAPVDLRVNRAKASVDEAQLRLEGEGVATTRVPFASDALRAAPGAPVARTGAYLDGWVEPQDAASQLAAAAVEAAAGEVILDYCAGGGGKSLAIAAALGGEGRVIAHDIAPARMATIAERAARAGVEIDVMAPDTLRDAKVQADAVFIDAPCSGSGSWRRDPEAKWRLTGERLAELITAQREAVRGGLAHLKPGGRLIYATCSVLVEENMDQAEWMEAEIPGLTRVSAKTILPLGESDGFFFAGFHVGWADR